MCIAAVLISDAPLQHLQHTLILEAERLVDRTVGVPGTPLSLDGVHAEVSLTADFRHRTIIVVSAGQFQATFTSTFIAGWMLGWTVGVGVAPCLPCLVADMSVADWMVRWAVCVLHAALRWELDRLAAVLPADLPPLAV